MVGAVLVLGSQSIGEGWHHKAGEPHAEIEAIRDAERRGAKLAGSSLYVTLEPCSTQGRTSACTAAVQTAGISRVIVAAIDPNPRHAGRGLKLLRGAGIKVEQGLLNDAASAMNEAFNHWIVKRTPFVTVKAAMTLDGKIATARGESKWITGEPARRFAMRLRQRADAILVGVNTILADDSSLTFRSIRSKPASAGILARSPSSPPKRLRRIILDANARTPPNARIVSDEFATDTTVVVRPDAPKARVAALSRLVRVWVAPVRNNRIDLRWLMRELGREEVTDLLVEGGGEVNASFLLNRLAQRLAFFYAPKILGGAKSIKAVGGEGLLRKQDWLRLRDVQWRTIGRDLLLTALV
jgi:diaminohydroxyphosphoribosylaminopyrimidine deaminase/5-amino-6-(5-phosphoribosylamino)uracil reductase